MIVLDQLAGTQINECFTLERLIGRGASGVVYRARHSTGHMVALKLVPPAARVELSARYLRGTRLAAELHHPNIVRVLESGRWGPSRRCYYLAMELVEGVPLGGVANAGMPHGQAVGLISQVLEAAAYVHACGTIHRDLKPDNVMVCRHQGDHLLCKVTDFGIAANRQREENVTRTGGLIGTPAYMAPEQSMGQTHIGPEIDLYALGVMLYELLSGQRPFSGTEISILYRKLAEPPPPLPNAAQLPQGLADIVMRMIARYPEDRIGHARDALVELAPYARPAVMDTKTWLRLLDECPGTGLGAKGSAARGTTAQVTADPFSETYDSGGLGPDLAVFDGAEPALWGREPILEQLEEHARQAEIGQPQVILLSGSVGVGKSALMRALSIQVQEQGRFQVLSTSFFQSSCQEGGLRGAVELSLGVRGQPANVVRAAVAEHMRRMGEENAEESEALVNWLRLGSSELQSGAPPGASDFSPGLRYLRRLARSRPVLLLIDDLHRGGGHSAALIEYLVFELGFEPLDLFVVAAVDNREMTTEFKNGLIRSAHAEGRTRHLIHVATLPISVVTRGLRQMFRISTAVAKQLAVRSAGNPLVAIGLAQAYGGQTLQTDPMSTWTSVDEGSVSSLNAMLERMLHSALDSLPDPERARAILQAVALLGPWVEVETLALFLETSVDDADFETLLDDLIDRDVLEEEGSQDADRVGLKPQVLAKMLLDAMGKRQLRRMRRRAIEVLSDASTADRGILGDHHHALGELAEAISCWKEAERRALLAGAPYVAAEQGLKIVAELAEPERSAWGIRLGQILLDAGDPGRAEAVLRPVCESTDVDLALVASDLLCDVYENMGKGAEWTALAEKIGLQVDQAGRSGKHAGLCALAMWRTSHSDDRAGRAAAEDALALAQSPEEIRRAAQRLTFSCLPSGSLSRATEVAEMALEASGDCPQLRVRSLRTLGVVRMWQGQDKEARKLHEQALALARWKGLSLRATLALQDLGDTLRLSGAHMAPAEATRATHLRQANERYEACIRAADALDLKSTVYLVRFKMLMCGIALDEEMDVEARLNALTAPAMKAGLGLAAPFAKLLLAWAMAKKGESERARAALEEAKILEGFQVDPQLPVIFEEIRNCTESGSGAVEERE